MLSVITGGAEQTGKFEHDTGAGAGGRRGAGVAQWLEDKFFVVLTDNWDSSANAGV